MNRNAINDPKVWYKLGEGGAPEEELGRMELLGEEYKKAGVMLTWLGFNGCLFDIKPWVTEKIIAPETDEAAVQTIINNK